MRAAGTPPVHIAGRGQDGGLQLHRGVVQSRPSPFWHPLSITNRLRDADAQGNPNDLSDKPSTESGQLHLYVVPPAERALARATFPLPLVLGSRGLDCLPLEIGDRIWPAAGKRHDVIFD